MKLFVRAMQGKIYPKPLSFHCPQFHASYARDCFQEIVLFKKCELSTWKLGNSQQQHIRTSHPPIQTCNWIFHLAIITSPLLSKRRDSVTAQFLGNRFPQDCCNPYSQARYRRFLLIHGKSILCSQHYTTKLHLLHLLLKAVCKGMVFLQYFIFISPNGTTLDSMLYYALTKMILLHHSIICLNLIKHNIAF